MYKPIFDLWSTNRSHRHRRCLLQNHPPISSLSDPPTNPTSFKPTHWSVVLYLSLSLNLSPSLSHDRCLFFSKIEFFFVIFFVDLVYIFGFPIIIFFWKLRKYERMCFLEDFPKHFLWCGQTLENIFISEKKFHLKIFYTLKSFYIEPNTASIVEWQVPLLNTRLDTLEQ